MLSPRQIIKNDEIGFDQGNWYNLIKCWFLKILIQGFDKLMNGGPKSKQPF